MVGVYEVLYSVLSIVFGFFALALICTETIVKVGNERISEILTSIIIIVSFALAIAFKVAADLIIYEGG